MSRIDTVHRYQSALRKLLLSRLADYDLLLSIPEYKRFHNKIMSDGASYWMRMLSTLGQGPKDNWLLALSALGIGPMALHRITGFGASQARVLATALNVDPDHIENVAWLGANLNLAIVLFDVINDRNPHLGEQLLTKITLPNIQKVMSGSVNLPSSQEPAIDVLRRLVQYFLTSLLRLDGPIVVQEELKKTIKKMYSAEVMLLDADRFAVKADLNIWRQLKYKSVLPIWTLALIGLHNYEVLGLEKLLTLKRQILPLGKMLWIIDDLADAGEDWLSGDWSRPWWQLSHSRGFIPGDIEDALSSLIEEGIIISETGRLIDLLCEFTHVQTVNPSLEICLKATIQSWIYGLPE